MGDSHKGRGNHAAVDGKSESNHSMKPTIQLRYSSSLFVTPHPAARLLVRVRCSVAIECNRPLLMQSCQHPFEVAVRKRTAAQSRQTWITTDRRRQIRKLKK